MDVNIKNKFKFQTYKILNKENIAPDTVLFTLKGKIKFEPGQFFQVALPHLGEATFAICSDPKNKNDFQFCIRAAGSTSNQIVKLLPGDELMVRGPYGNTWPIGKLIGKDVVIIAGGMGLVPLKPLIHELLQFQKEFKKLVFFAGFRTPEHVLFNDDLIIWSKKFDYFKVAVEKNQVGWWGETGMITDMMERLKFDTKNTIVLSCGPDIMFRFVNEVLHKKGVTDRQIYLSMERRMECGVGLCQHCNIGKYLVCQDGPIFRWDMIKGEVGK